ncbi:DMT family transporter [Pseudoruegeria sp. HB172150]|uniref:DMT family transporter n=1 Tax=Pseudoruegeria sp. HB172150 TaxID=2721164 RepID=UPI001557C51F|nr:DMT family transporter [Pseudoruegeria sp. HB172150]
MATALPREERTAFGLAIMALAVTFFTAIDTSAKWLILAGLAPLQVVFIRYAGHFAVALAVYLPQGGLAQFRSAAPWRQTLRAVFLLGSTVFNFLALRSLPITLTTTIMFATPIVVTLLAIPILGERVGIHRIVAVCTGFLGVVVTVQPWGVDFSPEVFLSLGALFCASGYFILTRMLAGIESNATSQLWASGLATFALAPFGIAKWVAPQDAGTIAVMLGIGALGAVGHIFATLAHRLAEASILAPVVYIQIFLAAFASILVFDTWPTVWTLGGGGIIIASGLYIWHRERQRSGVKMRAVRASAYGPRRK